MDHGMRNRLGRLGRLVRKELAEILRDRRTIITLVLMPILVYPLLAVAFQQYFSSLSPLKSPIYVLGFASQIDKDLFVRQLQLGDKILMRQDPQATPVMSSVTWPDKFDKNLKKMIEDGEIDVGIRLEKGGRFKGSKDDMFVFEAIFKKDSSSANTLLQFVERRLAATNGSFLRARLGIPGLPPARYVLLRRSGFTVPAAKQVSLAALVPLILILMTITGAVYPAIDLTAGERERGTLEILVAAPVPRLGLLFAKYVSVLTVAILTALINLLTMLITLWLSGLGAALFSGSDISLLVILQLLMLLLLFAAFFSAVLLAITSFARSFKEAQAYLIPLMLLSLAPGVLAMMPELSLEGTLSVAPLVNIVLLSRDLFEGNARWPIAVIVIASTLLYALAAIATAARIFGAEAVLYSEQSAWSDLFRRPEEERPIPAVASALLCLALIFPIWFVCRGLLAQLGGMSALSLLGLMTGIGFLLFAGFPLLSAWLGHIRLRTGLQLQAVPIVAFAGALLLGISLWPVLVQLLALVLPEPDLSTETLKQLLNAMRQARADYPLAVALAFVVQALAEELFFRGYLFSALRGKCGPAVTIIVSALLFGFFHVIAMPGPFALHRLLSSTFLGLVLGWIAWHTGSVFPGMIMHAAHNAMLVLIGPGEAAVETLPWSWVGAGLAGTVAGVVLLFGWGAKTENTHPVPAG